MPIGTRGLHLYPSPWYIKSDQSSWDKFQDDFDKLDYIGVNNLNSAKTAIYTYIEQGPDNRSKFLNRQRNKIERIVGKVGSNATYVFRCWPVWPNQGDWIVNSGVVNYYESGFHFAMELANAFSYIQNTLNLSNVIMEVANEPNQENPFIIATPPSAAYNDFFRGFYWGEREVGYTYNLAYAGLVPSFEAPGGSATSWYYDYQVQQHIAQYAAKIGVHIYWQPGYKDGLSEGEGKFYRTVKNILAGAGVAPRGIVITEFGTPRAAYGGSSVAQIEEVCAWWRNEQADANAGWWCEQAILYISNSDDEAIDKPNYWLRRSQLDTIRDC